MRLVSGLRGSVELVPAALVAVASEQQDVKPGHDASCVAVIRNDGDAPETFSMSVHGPASGWSELEESSLTLAPGEEGSLWIRFRPPAVPMTAAGPVPFSLRISASSDPSFVIIEAAVVRIAEVVAIEAEVVIPARPGRGG